MPDALKVKVILGSTRQGRYGDKPAAWIMSVLKEKGVDAELLDLRDWPLPFYDQEKTPSTNLDGSYGNPLADKWAAKIAEGDAFIVIAAEYNHGYTAVLKNAFDWVYKEWNKKPIAYVAYGSALGARAVEQLREVAVELQMAPMRNAVHIPADIFQPTWKKELSPEILAHFAPLKERGEGLIDQLLWWAKALKAAR